MTYKTPIGEEAEVNDVPINVPLNALNEQEIGDAVKALIDSDPEAAQRLLMDGRILSRLLWTKGRYDDCLTDNHRQVLEGDKGPIRVTQPSMGEMSGTLHGNAALRLISNATGVGKMTTIPLWASGMRVTIDNVKEADLLTLQTQLEEAKEEISTTSRNLIYSADDVVVNGIIINFILDHIVDCTVRDWNKALLLDLILAVDIQPLMAGALATMYPRGYPVYRQCSNIVNKCDYSTIQDDENGGIKTLPMLDFRKVTVTDETKIDIVARRFVESPMGAHTAEMVKAYQAKLRPTTLSPPLNEDSVLFRAEFKTPNLHDYIMETNSWLSSVRDMAITALETSESVTPTAAKARRERYIEAYKKRLYIQKNIPWIAGIHVNDTQSDEEQAVIKNDPKFPGDTTILDAVAELCKDMDVKTSLLDQIEDYKKKAILTLAGIPNHACPKCGSGQITEEELANGAHPTLIPINMGTYFLEVMGWKLHALEA